MMPLSPMPKSQLVTARGVRLSTQEGRTVSLRSTRFEVDCRAGVARVELRLVFVNAHADPLGVTCTMPLPADAAVTGFRSTIGDRKKAGPVRRRADKRESDGAKSVKGRTTTQEPGQPNLFTQKIGTVPPKARVELTLTVEQQLGRVNEGGSGRWEWRFPALVAAAEDGSEPVDVEMTVMIRDSSRSEPVSPSHAIAVDSADDGWRVAPKDGAASLEREFVVRWAGARSAAGAKPGAAGSASAADGAAGRASRVVRSEDGVIVGAAGRGPKIVGFIPLAETRSRAGGRSVVVTEPKREEPAQGGRASQRKRREQRALGSSHRRRSQGRGSKSGRSSGPASAQGTVEMSEKKKHLRIDGAIRVADLAHRMGQPAAQILRNLWGMGHRSVTINDPIDFETAEIVASEFGYTAEDVAFREDEVIVEAAVEEGELRAPVVAVMGHVDHGKTSLLDYIRGTRVAAGEAGGITQHIGAQRVSTPAGDVVFLDTPGHAAFGAMRQRGAGVTDIALLVVAADDGVMPTTIEAIKHAQKAGVALVVALNKMDKPEANPGRVKQALMEWSIVGEEFGGDVPIVEISAKTGQGVDALLEVLALQAELLELRAPTDGHARGVVLEARIDKGRGVITTVLVQAGTLARGNVMVVGELSGKVRGLLGPDRKTLKSVGPSSPVEVLGLSGIPPVGEPFAVVDGEREARTLVAHRREQRMRGSGGPRVPSIAAQLARDQRPMLRLILKADVQGSAQALADALAPLGDDEVDVEVLEAEVGQIAEADIKLAQASDAMIVGFNVKAGGRAMSTAEAQGVTIQTFRVIYEAIDAVADAVADLHAPEFREVERGEAEVRALFPIPKAGVVAGCRVTRGVVGRHCHVRVLRGDEIVHDGTIASLRIFNDDVREVKDGFECGIVIEGFGDLEEGDRLQAYEVETVKRAARK